MADALAKSHNRWLQLDGDVLLSHGWTVHNQFFLATHALDWRNFEGYTYNATTSTVDVSSYLLIWRNDLLVGDRGDVRKTFDIGGHDLAFMAGAEAQRNDLKRAGNPTPTFPVPVVKLDPFNPKPFFDPGYNYVRQRDVLINTKAVFAEGSLAVVPRLKLVTGIRWEGIDLGYTPYPSLVTAAQTYQPVTGRSCGLEITPNANVYTSFSRAVEPTTQLVSLDGSRQRSAWCPAASSRPAPGAERLRHRLEGTFAYFTIAKHDLLITQLINGIQTAQQVGEQASQGIELAVVGRPTSTLTLSSDVAYTSANFVDFVEIVGGVNTDRSGNTPPNIPNVIWNFSPTQRVGPLDLTGTIRHLGTRWADNGNTRLVAGFTTGCGGRYRMRRGMRVMLRGRNLTDQIYTQSVSNTSGRLEPPRAVDVTFTADLKR